MDCGLEHGSESDSSGVGREVMALPVQLANSIYAATMCRAGGWVLSRGMHMDLARSQKQRASTGTPARPVGRRGSMALGHLLQRTVATWNAAQRQFSSCSSPAPARHGRPGHATALPPPPLARKGAPPSRTLDAREYGLYGNGFKRLARGSRDGITAGELPLLEPSSTAPPSPPPRMLLPRAVSPARTFQGNISLLGAAVLAPPGTAPAVAAPRPLSMRYNPFAGQPERKRRATIAAQGQQQGYLLRSHSDGVAQRLAQACGAAKRAGGVGTAALRAGPPVRPGTSTKLAPLASTDDTALVYVQQARAFIAGHGLAMSPQAASRVPALAGNDSAALVTLPNPPGANLCGLNAMLQALNATCSADLQAALVTYVDALPPAERTDPENTRARDLGPLARVLRLMSDAPTTEARATLMRETMAVARRYRRVASGLRRQTALDVRGVRAALACSAESVPLTGAQAVVEEVVWHMLNGFATAARTGTVPFSAHAAAAFMRVQQKETRTCRGGCGFSFTQSSNAEPWAVLSQPLTDAERAQVRSTPKLDRRSVQEYLQATTRRVVEGELYRCLRCHGLRHCVGKGACGKCTVALLEECPDVVDGARVTSRRQAIVDACNALMAGSVDKLPGVGCGSFKEARLQRSGVLTEIRTSNVFIALTPAETAKNGAPQKLQHKVMVTGDLVLEVPHAGGSGAASSGASSIEAHGGSGASSSSSGAGSSSGSGSSAAATGESGSGDVEAGDSVRSYTLSAVVFHCGPSNASGHYVAIRKLPSGAAWAVLDDNRVSAIIAANVIEGSASGTPDELEKLNEMRRWHALAYFYTAGKD